MNNDNELLRNFNDTFSDNNEPSVTPYRAVQNQNVVQQGNFGNNVNNNVVNFYTQNNTSANITMPDFVNQNNVSNTAIPNFVNQAESLNMVPEANNVVNVVNDNNNFNTSNNVEINEQPQLYNTTGYINNNGNNVVSQKRKKVTVKIDPELKTAILIAIVLLVVMLFVPTLFDLYENLKLKIFG